ncbi:MAG: anthranilate phosphoribosyltransferase [Solirubrobacterales bacterium]
MPNPILTRAIEAVCSDQDLTTDHAAAVLAEVMRGDASEVETAGFLIGLRAKGETVPELVGFARTMREMVTPVDAGDADLLDTAGTGGGPSTFNVSTTAALIAAAAGCRVAKHGNRSATSKSGSADMLEALGVRIHLDPDAIGECIRTVGFGYMHAPAHHTAYRHVVPVRKELGVRTIFNFVGPLTNPAGAGRALMGISDRRFQESVAEAHLALGTVHALVVNSDDGLDELSISAPTRVIEVFEGKTAEWYAEAEELGLKPAPLEAVAGGEPGENAAVAREILGGAPGPQREIALLNAGAAIYAGGQAGDLGAGVEKAAEAVDTGAALETLEMLIETTNGLAGPKEQG